MGSQPPWGPTGVQPGQLYGPAGADPVHAAAQRTPFQLAPFLAPQLVALSFRALAVKVDNPTPAWIFFPAINRWVPPNWFGSVFKWPPGIDGTNITVGSDISPAGPQPLPPVSAVTATAQISFTDEDLPESAGSGASGAISQMFLTTLRTAPIAGSTTGWVGIPVPAGAQALIVTVGGGAGVHIELGLSQFFPALFDTANIAGGPAVGWDYYIPWNSTIGSVAWVRVTGNNATVYVSADFVPQSIAGLPPRWGPMPSIYSTSVTMAPDQAALPIAPGAGAGAGQQAMAASLPVVVASDQAPIEVELFDANEVGITLGQKAMAASLPVVMASDQAPIEVELFDANEVGITLGQKAPASSLPVVMPTSAALWQAPNKVPAGLTGAAIASNAIVVLVAAVGGQTCYVFSATIGFDVLPTGALPTALMDTAATQYHQFEGSVLNPPAFLGFGVPFPLGLGVQIKNQSTAAVTPRGSLVYSQG